MQLLTVILVILIIIQLIVNAIVLPLQGAKIHEQHKKIAFRNRAMVINGIILTVLIVIYLFKQSFVHMKKKKNNYYDYESEFSRKLQQTDPDFKKVATRMKEFYSV